MQDKKRDTRITHAPLPGLEVFRAIFMRWRESSEELTLWDKGCSLRYWIGRTSYSFAALADARKSIYNKDIVNIWVPDYFCNEALGPVRSCRVRLIFYPVDSELNADLGLFPIVTDENKPDIVILTHYFGQAARGDQLSSFCKEQRCWLVEDAAHIMLPIEGVGDFGDFVVYSPHKHFAIPNGAVIIVRLSVDSEESCYSQVKSFLDAYVQSLRSMSSWRSRSYCMYWLLKRFAQIVGIRRPVNSNKPNIRASMRRRQPVPAAMSLLSKKLLLAQLTRKREYQERTLIVEQRWQRMIESIYVDSSLAVSESESFPYLARIRASSRLKSERVYSDLSSVGLPVTKWPDLAPEVVEGGNYNTAKQFYELTSFLPVHQSVSFRDILNIESILRKEHIRSWSISEVESSRKWADLLLRCQRVCLSQTWQYGEAKHSVEGWYVKHLLIKDADKREVSVAMILTRWIPGIGRVARLNRGPLLLGNVGNDDIGLTVNSIVAIKMKLRELKCRVLLITPFTDQSEQLETGLRACGLQKWRGSAMDSALLDLGKSEDELRKNLKSKWRNALRKGERSGVRAITIENTPENLDLLLKMYASQQLDKRYRGTSEGIIRSLCVDDRDFSLQILKAVVTDERERGEQLLGMLVTLEYFGVSEYFIGVTNEYGRSKQANSVLLWEAIVCAKKRRCRVFDVGGLDSSTPPGITRFKAGLNARPYMLSGEWIGFVR